MTPASEWTESYAEAARWVAALRKTVKYAFRRIVIVRHDGAYGRTYYRVETD